MTANLAAGGGAVTPCCALSHGCATAPISVVRLRPTRTDAPWCVDVKRGLVWPGMALVIDVRSCASHLKATKGLGFVLGETPLGMDVVTRTVSE